MSVWSAADTAIATLSLPYAAGRYWAASTDELPDVFMVYNLVTAPRAQSADDDESLRVYTMQVSYFNRSGLVAVPDITTAMKAQGFQYRSQREIPYDEKSRHFGLAIDYTYLEET